ncbi:MAG: hypothetical protein ACK559_16870, partial [bacterium]
MTTSRAARVVGLDGVLGSLTPGMIADISVFAWSSTPYQAIIQSQPDDVRLVLLGGDALYGVPELVSATSSLSAWCETVSPCGAEARALCVRSAETG